MESKFNMYVRIEGEPFLSKAIAYRDEMHRVRKAIWEFARARSASEVPGSLTGLIFKGGKMPPEGWTKPDRKGFSKPKKDHPDIAAMKALPRLPKTFDVFGDTLIYDLKHEGPDGSWGFGAIGWFFDGPHIGWADDTFIATIPNAKAAAAEYLANHPNEKITNGADQWTLPAGLVEMTKAEVDLLYAQHAVEQEKKEKARAA